MARIGIVPEHQLGCDGWDFVEDHLTITAVATRDHHLTIQQQSVANVTQKSNRDGDNNTATPTATTTTTSTAKSAAATTDQRAKGIRRTTEDLSTTEQP
jgi:hypothetical protein